MRIAFATSLEWPQSTPDDRLAATALGGLGVRVEPAVWSDPAVDWSSWDAVVVRSVWDYHLAPERFQAWIARVEATGTPLWNPPDALRWNLDKAYLAALAQAGIDVVPTLRVARVDAAALGDLPWAEVVLKPAVSASAWMTRRVAAGDHEALRAAAAPILERGDLLVQPFLSTVVTAGEWSLMFFGGRYSHSVLKRPAAGDFRVQDEHGGGHHPCEPPAAAIDAATRAVRACGPTLYARIDGLFEGSVFRLMEAELIEPHLYFAADPGAPQRFAATLVEACRTRRW